MATMPLSPGHRLVSDNVMRMSYLDNLFVTLTRRSILGSDGMTKSDCSLALWELFKCSLSAFWVILKSSWSHPEVILKSSWSHPEESEAERWKLWALEHFSSNRQTNEHLHFLSSCRNQKQVRMKLDNEDTGKGLKLVPETYGMNVPSSCTIVIIAGTKWRPVTQMLW